MANVKKQLKEKTCPVCGRNYIFHDFWAYKIVNGTRIISFCSWSCMRKAEKDRAQQKKQKKVVAG